MDRDNAQELVSVIVPVYNGQKRIERCLNSIVSQSYKNLEILVINDGSTDATGEILDGFAARDGRIKPFHIENGGVSNARNYGLNNASGEFVTFVDCDDYITSSAIEKLYSFAKDCTDMVQGAFTVVNDQGIGSSARSTFRQIITGGEDILSAFFKSQIYPAVWGKLYRRSAIAQLRFDTQIAVGEDDLFTYQVCKQANQVVLTDEPLYFYIDNQDSVMRKSLEEKHFKIFDVIDIQLSENKANKHLYELCSLRDVKCTRSHIYLIFEAKSMYEKFSMLRERLINQKKVFLTSKDFSLKDKFLFFLLWVAPDLYFKLKILGHR